MLAYIPYMDPMGHGSDFGILLMKSDYHLDPSSFTSYFGILLMNSDYHLDPSGNSIQPWKVVNKKHGNIIYTWGHFR